MIIILPQDIFSLQGCNFQGIFVIRILSLRYKTPILYYWEISVILLHLPDHIHDSTDEIKCFTYDLSKRDATI